MCVSPAQQLYRDIIRQNYTRATEAACPLGAPRLAGK